MENDSQRNNRRLKIAIRADVSDRAQENTVRCTICDGSTSGCKIISRHVPNLPDNILIKVPNLNRLIKGHIVWRDHNSAGIEFKWETNHPDERRGAARQEVDLPSTIMDYGLNKLADCIIRDASTTGCRISSEAIYEIPDDVLIEIPGLTEPVLALIVWRNGNLAGLEFFWGSEVCVLDDLVAM